MMATLGRLFGTSPKGSWIEVDDDALQVRMGIMARGTIPRANIRRAEPMEWAWWAGFGVRWYGPRHWGLIGSNQGVVELEIDPPTRVRMVLPVRVRRLALSLDDPEELLRLLDPAPERPPGNTSGNPAGTDT